MIREHIKVLTHKECNTLLKKHQDIVNSRLKFNNYDVNEDDPSVQKIHKVINENYCKGNFAVGILMARGEVEEHTDIDSWVSHTCYIIPIKLPKTKPFLKQGEQLKQLKLGILYSFNQTQYHSLIFDYETNAQTIYICANKIL